MARAAATAYEVILEYLEDAGERIMDLNPLKLKQKKLNLLIDDDDDEDEVSSSSNDGVADLSSPYRV